MFPRLMQAVHRVTRALGTSFTQTPGQPGDVTALGRLAVYELMEAFYKSNGLYTNTQAQMFAAGLWYPGMKPLRNPAYRACRFYSKKLWPGGDVQEALPIAEGPSKNVIDAIWKVWEQSNWAAMKQVFALWLPLYGDVFIQVGMENENTPSATPKVVFGLPNPKTVIEFDTDARGIVTYCRIDTEAQRRESDDLVDYTLTEVWDLDAGYRVWEHEREAGSDLGQLGNADADRSRTLQDLGVDFIPIVHCKFIDEGDSNGVACLMPVLDKVNELNAMMTRMCELLALYNKPTTVLGRTGTNKQGQPLPPVTLRDDDGNKLSNSEDLNIPNDFVWRLPGDVTVQHLVPPINYPAFMAAIEALYAEIRRDLPELAYSDVMEAGMESGVARRYKLADTIDKCAEVRGNAERALIRANQMALTIGQAHGVFSGLGDYHNGDFDHAFVERDILPQTDLERAQSCKTWVEAGVPLHMAASWGGVADDDVEALISAASPALTEQTPEDMDAIAAAQGAALQPKIAELVDVLAAGVTDAVISSGALEREMKRIANGQERA